MIDIKNRKLNIPSEEKKIGFIDDNGMEQRIFVIPKMYGNIDLTNFIFKLDIQKSDETKGVVDLIKNVNGDTIELTWNIDESQLTSPGQMAIQIRAYQDLDEDTTNGIDYIWHSEIGRVEVKDIINAVGEFEGNLPSEFYQLEQRITLAVQTTLDQIVDLEAYISKFNVWENWNENKSYEINNKVFYEGSSYTCIASTIAGTLPTDTTYWQLIAAKGDQGIQGETGEQGPEGPQGPIGETGPAGEMVEMV